MTLHTFVKTSSHFQYNLDHYLHNKMDRVKYKAVIKEKCFPVWDLIVDCNILQKLHWSNWRPDLIPIENLRQDLKIAVQQQTPPDREAHFKKKKRQKYQGLDVQSWQRHPRSNCCHYSTKYWPKGVNTYSTSTLMPFFLTSIVEYIL